MLVYFDLCHKCWNFDRNPNASGLFSLIGPIKHAVPGTVLKPCVHGAFERILKPNITGRFWDLTTNTTTGRMGSADGAFQCPPKNPEQSSVMQATVTTSTSANDGIGFDASSSNSTYLGSSLQPAAAQVLIIIKT